MLIIIEEAHESLSASRIAKMPILFEQVSRIAKRGRKRWLGLVFITRLPQHLPTLGLVNNYVLHNSEGGRKCMLSLLTPFPNTVCRRFDSSGGH